MIVFIAEFVLSAAPFAFLWLRAVGRLQEAQGRLRVVESLHAHLRAFILNPRGYSMLSSLWHICAEMEAQLHPDRADRIIYSLPNDVDSVPAVRAAGEWGVRWFGSVGLTSFDVVREGRAYRCPRYHDENQLFSTPWEAVHDAAARRQNLTGQAPVFIREVLPLAFRPSICAKPRP